MLSGQDQMMEYLDSADASVSNYDSAGRPRSSPAAPEGYFGVTALEWGKNRHASVRVVMSQVSRNLKAHRCEESDSIWNVR